MPVDAVDTRSRPKVAYVDEREKLVAQLETMLEKAKEGEFIALAITSVCADGAVATSYTVTARGSVFTLLGGLVNQQHRILSAVEDCVE